MEKVCNMKNDKNILAHNKKISCTNKLFHISMVLFLSLMVGLVFINAVMRYAFHDSIPESEEFARFFFMWTVFLGVIAAFQDKGHVSVTILIDKLKGRAKITVYIISQLITLTICILVLIGGIQYTISASTYASVATGINFGIVVSGFVVMMAGTTIVILIDTSKTLKQMLKGE